MKKIYWIFLIFFILVSGTDGHAYSFLNNDWIHINDVVFPTLVPPKKLTSKRFERGDQAVIIDILNNNCMKLTFKVISSTGRTLPLVISDKVGVRYKLQLENHDSFFKANESYQIEISAKPTCYFSHSSAWVKIYKDY